MRASNQPSLQSIWHGDSSNPTNVRPPRLHTKTHHAWQSYKFSHEASKCANMGFRLVCIYGLDNQYSLNIKSMPSKVLRVSKEVLYWTLGALWHWRLQLLVLSDVVTMAWINVCVQALTVVFQCTVQVWSHNRMIPCVWLADHPWHKFPVNEIPWKTYHY